MNISNRWDAAKFIEAQAPVYDRVLQELRNGHKQSHWMWFIFPQLAGLGSSAMSRRFAICGKEEALAYVAHSVLGPRLRECTEIVLASPPGTTAAEIFPYPDDLKFRSSLTLFSSAAPGEILFRTALDRFFGGEPDPATLRILRTSEQN